FAGDVADTVASKAERAGVKFERRISEDLGEMTVDPGVVSAALVNILENAVEACADDRSDAEHTASFRADGDEAEVVFEVVDDGPGMDRETRERMFTLFFSSKGNKGTGLGLFIAHRMVKQHGGEIAVESEPGRGARFAVRLPRNPGLESEASSSGEARPRSASEASG
ncbi:MAG: sensor histidine kinase, partial [Desulfococcaceae bacterium]